MQYRMHRTRMLQCTLQQLQSRVKRLTCAFASLKPGRQHSACRVGAACPLLAKPSAFSETLSMASRRSFHTLLSKPFRASVPTCSAMNACDSSVVNAGPLATLSPANRLRSSLQESRQGSWESGQLHNTYELLQRRCNMRWHYMVAGQLQSLA